MPKRKGKKSLWTFFKAVQKGEKAITSLTDGWAVGRPPGQKRDPPPPLAGGPAPKQHAYCISKHPPSPLKCP